MVRRQWRQPKDYQPTDVDPKVRVYKIPGTYHHEPRKQKRHRAPVSSTGGVAVHGGKIYRYNKRRRRIAAILASAAVLTVVGIYLLPLQFPTWNSSDSVLPAPSTTPTSTPFPVKTEPKPPTFELIGYFESGGNTRFSDGRWERWVKKDCTFVPGTTGAILISVQPASADIIVDGAFKGRTTPLGFELRVPLDSGEHEIRVVNEYYREFNAKVCIHGQAQRISVTLESLTASPSPSPSRWLEPGPSSTPFATITSSITQKSDAGSGQGGSTSDWDAWVNQFIAEVNKHRLFPLKEMAALNDAAEKRAAVMLQRPEISHYGAEFSPYAEVVFFPSGESPAGYAAEIRRDAPLHWEALVDPSFSSYGYAIAYGPVYGVYPPCPVTEIPGPYINVPQFFQKYGCSVTTDTGAWLTIELS